ncbi:hypothetical protein GJ496_008757 [Pomphorhynchus laevis]|nr:hypothetical protein GJ496_008757 [Pomphorhynchus laevis]
MYFACLSPIVTFGGLLSKATDNNMGTIESLVAAAVCGCLYHSFAGQPLTILGSTGPVLIFETIVFSLCKRHNIDFMGLRVWIGIWMFLILAILVMTDGCSLISHITRFTEESFAALIGLIFIWEAINKMIELHTNLHPELDGTCTDCINSMKSVLPGLSKEQCQNISIQFANASVAFSNEIHNVSLKSANCGALLNMSAIFWFSLVLFLTTFFLAFYLKNFKRKRYFPSKLRSLISNFSVVIIIGVTVTIDFLSQLGTPKLVVPDKFQNTRPNRGWFISPFGRISVLHCFISLFPAMLATILIFMDQNITTVIINRRENKLKAGCGYHLDMMIVAICIMINSLYGLPWFVAATVLSVNHVISLKIESTCKMPGEKPKFTGVIEQRATGFIAYTLIGLSVFLTKFLRHIPMPVLYGLFLFMGISSLAEIQFWNRVLLLFMPEKYQPDYIYLRHVSTRRVHLFTIIQMACMIVLWIVKSIKLIAIAFPLMVALLIAVRKLLGHIFTQRELMYLDDAKPESRKRAEEDAKKEISISITGTSAETNKPSKQGETECKKLITSPN